nr:hypothetical protein [Butyrivibrio sp.]
VSASVSQEYISQLTVGQSAKVTFDEYGTYDGVITAINPVTQSSSRSSVTFTVTVELEGDVSALSQNLSATVTFEAADTETADTGEKEESENADAQTETGETTENVEEQTEIDETSENTEAKG